MTGELRESRLPDHTVDGYDTLPPVGDREEASGEKVCGDEELAVTRLLDRHACAATVVEEVPDAVGYDLRQALDRGHETRVPRPIVWHQHPRTNPGFATYTPKRLRRSSSAWRFW